MTPEDCTHIFSAHEGRKGTPKKYAGPKFHTTSPSPKSLPIPVFSSGLPHQSLSSSLPATSSTSSFIEDDNQNPFLLESAHASRSMSSLPSSIHNSSSRQRLKSQSAQQKSPDPTKQRRRHTASNNELNESRMKANSTFKGNTSDSEASSTRHSSRNASKTVGCVSILSRDRKFEQKTAASTTTTTTTTTTTKDIATKTGASRHRKRTSDPNPSLHSMSHNLKQMLRIVDARAS